MTLLAAFQVLLHRYTGQDDIAVGSPIAGRTRTETEGLIGFFVNTLVLRTKLSGDPTFKELLSRVRITALQAYEHQDLPFEKLVEELNPERSQSQTPLFQVSLAVQNVPQSNLDIPELKVTPVEINSSTAKFDLAAAFIEHEREMTVRIEYRRELFEAATIERMFGHFERLLEGIVANPEQRISKLPLLNDAEKHQLLVKWNDTRAEYPKDQSIHELFEEQVERTPEAVAVVYEDQQMTYRELNQKANQLAHYLGERGVRAEALIAVFMERSLEMVIAILGVLKAGGAYVPIDPDTPTDRLKFMLQDTQTPLILTQERFSSYLEEFVDQRICLDSAWEELSRESQENPKSQVDGETAAYTIYTSGSTGTPKGVINVHGGLRNRLQWMQESYQLTAADRVLQKTPFTFDVSVWEFFWPLISGATLVIARPGGHRDSAYLLQVIQSKRITTMHFVPSMLGVFLQEAGVENCPSLKRVFCSGEALSYELQQLFFERIGAPLHNLYGPTEASIDVTAWKCRGDRDRTVVPIGRPIANTQVYILDQYLAPVPIGVVGEIHIGGLGLARGYLNQPELMAEKFIYRSFEGEPARRLYKTGDLARYLADGNIEFLGRIDNQVKLRGYRIELGEIEAVLVQHPMVQSSVVVVREDEPGDKRLVGYVVARLKETFDAAEVRQYLKHKLPEYLIPAALVLLDELPLTPSGKVDRRALPAPDQNGLQLANVYQPPRTPTEETLVTIWGKVLKLDKVGIYDNFFDVGGHSLLGTQVMSRIRSAFSIDLPLRHMFESPTVAEMADVITQSQWKQASEAELAQLLGEVEATTEEDAQKMLTT
jgi:amino acid adenylation domain-containing protein